MMERSGRIEVGLPWRDPKPRARGRRSLGKILTKEGIDIFYVLVSSKRSTDI